MSRTTTLRRQHGYLIEAAAELNRRAQSIAFPADASEAAMLLAKMVGVVNVHLAAEDKSLYPRMIASPDPAVAETARRFQARMGDVSQTFVAYATRWSTAQPILANTAGFRKETAAVIGALTRRIEQEDETLYPLADAMGGGTVLPAA